MNLFFLIVKIPPNWVNSILRAAQKSAPCTHLDNINQPPKNVTKSAPSRQKSTLKFDIQKSQCDFKDFGKTSSGRKYGLKFKNQNLNICTVVHLSVYHIKMTKHHCLFQ